MAKKRFYAVQNGRVPGIYETWPEAEEQVKGFPGAVFQGFGDRESAEAFMQNGPEKKDIPAEKVKADTSKVYDDRHADIFVDGSYNPDTNEYGYGVYVDDRFDPHIFVGKGGCAAGGRNIEGEVKASEVALDYAVRSGKYDSVTIHHDYEGIGRWGNGDWRANKDYTVKYGNFVNKVRQMGLAVDFNHVDGHTGVDGNEYVDKLAKIGCGIELRPSEKAFVEKLRDVPGFPNMRLVPECPDAEYEELAASLSL